MLPPPTIPSRSANVSETSGTLDVSAARAARHDDNDTQPRSASSFKSFQFTERAYMPHGVFAGRHMKFHLEVAQEPIHGRRKTDKDRRPLAHCPIVRLRLLECRRINDTSTFGGWEQGWEEADVDLSSLECANFICAAELNSPDTSSSSTPTKQSGTHTYHPTPHQDNSRQANVQFPHRPPPAPLSVYPSRSVDGDVTMDATGTRSSPEVEAGPSSSHRQQQYQHPSYASSTPQVMQVAHDAPLHMPPKVSHEVQESKDQRRAKAWGRNLYGNAHVSGIRVPAPEGGLGLWFLFTDLSVRHEGSYSLHFRCFDITAVPDDSPYPSPPLVTTTSQNFKVYSPRNFPGIPKPTELAEHFNRLGFKLNTRKNERLAEVTPSTTPTRRPSPQPVQHHDSSSAEPSQTKTASSTGPSAHHRLASGTGTASSSGTETGTLTDRSSTGESLMLSGGSGGMPGMPGGLPDPGRRESK